MRQNITIIFAKALFVLTISTLALTASAQQFKKPITSPRDRAESSEAKWNVGILGGVDLTTWLHFNSREASNWYLKNYQLFDTITNSMSYFGGIGVERMLKSNLSVGLNVVYAQHKVKLGFLDNHFPYQWDTQNDTILYGQIVKSFTANYHNIEAYVPLTYYIDLASTKNIKPYVYFAPRISYVLPIKQSQMTYSASYLDTIGAPIINPITHDTMVMNTQVPFNRSTYRKLNVGGTIGVGSLFKINISNYYLLFKFDLSANMNAISTFKQGQIINEEFNHLRYSTSAYATLSLMLPIKKPLQDACIRWGRYD